MTPHLQPVNSEDDMGDALRALRQSLTETHPVDSSGASGDTLPVDELSPRDLERDVRAMVDAWIEQVRRELDQSLEEARVLTQERPTARVAADEEPTIAVPAVVAVPVDEPAVVAVDDPAVVAVDDPLPSPTSTTGRQIRRVLAGLALPLLAIVLFVAALLSWIG